MLQDARDRTASAAVAAAGGHWEYSARVIPVAALERATTLRMIEIYLGIYDGSSEALFLRDLAGKDEVLLVHAGERLVGFTTLRFLRREWGGRPISVVYSGDTVVERRHWGQQALAFSWIGRMGRYKREHPARPLYWFLLVKGHRTFRYLPIFGKSFYPHWRIDRRDLKPLADLLGAEMFPGDYNPSTGVVEFAESHGHLRPEFATPSPDELRREGVQFFVERNPGFREGHELVCICEVEEHNMRPLTLSLFRKGALD